MLRSLTMRSELLTLSGVSHLEPGEGYVVQRTPSEPDFWFGNQLILPDAQRTPSETFALFETHFPDASHRAVVWDNPDMKRDDISDFEALGAKIEAVDALSLQGPLRQVPTPAGISLRALEQEADWAQALELAVEIGIEEGYDLPTHEPYLAGRIANRRASIARGLGQWFGAFDGDVLVAQMGMFHDVQVARYQAVETRMSHRKRGICSALLRHAALWAVDRAPDVQVVIVAEEGSAAGRLYRSMGFAHAETIFGVMKPGY